MDSRITDLRERWSNPLLTALTGLIAVLIAPLQASGLFVFQAFELVFAIILVAGVSVMSGSRTAVAAMLVSLVMATVGAIFRLKAPSNLDINLFAGSWLIMGITLGWAVSGAVFAPGRVTYHHIMGAILLYLAIAVTFLALFTFVAALIPKAFSGLSIEDTRASQRFDLFQLRDADHHRLWRHLSGAPDRTQPVQCGINLRPALSRDIARETRDARNRASALKVEL